MEGKGKEGREEGKKGKRQFYNEELEGPRD